MIDCNVLGALFKEHDIRCFSGVPCSYLKPLINYASNELDYLPACNEGEAVAIAVGARMAGKRAAVLLQNSGLTNALAPLTSLTNICETGVLGFVGFRGPPGAKDEPQHMIMGEIGQSLLEKSGVHVEVLNEHIESLKSQIDSAVRRLDRGQSVFFMVPEGHFSPLALNQQQPVEKRPQSSLARHTSTPKHTRYEILTHLHQIRTNETALLATTGKTGRELFSIEDHPGNFYMVGSMGCVSSIGLGLAYYWNKRVIAIDGDGALLMRMGNLASNALCAPPNLLHILLDNECHDSTGGQRTASTVVDWAGIASAAGYPSVHQLTAIDDLHEVITQWQLNPTLTFIHVPIQAGSIDPLPRPDQTPAMVFKRLQSFCRERA